MRSSTSTAAESASPSPAVKEKQARKPRRKRPVTPSELAANQFAVTRYRVASTRTRGYVVRAFPTAAQAERLNQLIGQGRYLWNWLLGVQETAYRHGLSLHNPAGREFLNLATTMKLARAREGAARVLTHPTDPSMWGEHWLVGCPRTLVTQKSNDLNESWKRFFAGIGGRPQFKHRTSRDSVRFQVDSRQHDREVAIRFPEESTRPRDAAGDLLPFPPAFRQGRDPMDTWVKIPNVGRVRVELNEPVHGRITSLTVRRRPCGRRGTVAVNGTWAGYELVLTAQAVPVGEKGDHPKNWARRKDWEQDSRAHGGDGKLGTGLGERDPAGVVALDLSVPDRTVTSNGDVLGRRGTDPYTAKKHAAYLKRCKRDQKGVARKARHRQREAGFGLKPTDPGYRGGSHQPVPLPAKTTWSPEQKLAMQASGRQKVRATRGSKSHATAKRQTTHDANVFTTGLVLMFHTIVVEGLTLKAMARSLSRGFRRGFNEAAMGEILRMLTYKCDLYGRTLVVADKWFPSSKRCHGCHRINPALKLRERQWTCAGCGRPHERDPNATYNLWQEGWAAVGIPTGEHFTPFTAGESPGAGRRGLQRWIGFSGKPRKPRSTAAGEASRARGNPGLVVSTKSRHARRVADLRLG